MKSSLSDEVGCREAFVECLQSEGCPIQLQDCEIDCQVLATALTGNSRVTRLVLPVSLRNDANMPVLFTALANNKGLLYLHWNMRPTSDENLSLLCQSLQAHPTLTCLDLRDIRPMGLHGDRFVSPDDRIGLAGEKKAQRTSFGARMMQHNTVLQTLYFSASERDNTISTKKVLPLLETNQYRPWVLAVKRTVDRPFREKILGRALYCVRSKPKLVWMFLSQNVDAFVRSEEEEEEEENTIIEETVAVEAAILVVAGSSKRKRSIV
jgi:hypothetical protein